MLGILITIISTSIISCGNSDLNEVQTSNESSIQQEKESKTKKEEKKSREDYLNYKSHKELVTNKGEGLFSKVKLKEPLIVKGKVIDGDIVNREVEERERVKESTEGDRGEIEGIEEEKEESKEENVKEVISNENIAIEDLDKSVYMIYLREQLHSQLINNGYLLLYSDSKDEIFNTEYAIRRINIINEGLETMDSTLKQLVSDNDKFMACWDKLYLQLNKGKEKVSSISEEYTVEQCKKDIDLQEILKSYNELEVFINEYITY